MRDGMQGRVVEWGAGAGIWEMRGREVVEGEGGREGEVKRGREREREGKREGSGRNGADEGEGVGRGRKGPQRTGPEQGGPNGGRRARVVDGLSWIFSVYFLRDINPLRFGPGKGFRTHRINELS